MTRITTLLAGIVVATLTQPAAAGQFRTVACSGTFRDNGQIAPLTILYRIGERETQVWDDGDGVWRRSGCTKNGRCTFDDRRVYVTDGYLSQGRGGLLHRLAIDRPTGRLEELWFVRDEILEFDAQCRPAADPAPDADGIAPHQGHDLQPTEYSLPSGYPYPMTRSRFEPRFRNP